MTISSQTVASNSSPNTAPISANGLVAQADRIVFHFDGNNNDLDDIPAIPIAALLARAAGIEDRTMFLYGNNLSEKSNTADGRLEKLDKSAAFARKMGVETQNYQDDIVGTTQKLIELIETGDKILLIEGGPMEAVYRAIAAVDPALHRNLTLLSHSEWNQNRSHVDAGINSSARTWNDLREDFPGLRLIEIAEQNGYDLDENGRPSYGINERGFHNSNWNWLDKSEVPAFNDARSLMKQLYSSKSNDPSDAGMLFYALTGIERGTALDARDYLNSSNNFNDKEPIFGLVHAYNIGGNAYSAADGTVYAADPFGEGRSHNRKNADIGGTVDDALYQTGVRATRSEPSLNYDISLENGFYKIVLGFSQVHGRVDGTKRKTADIVIEGRKVLENYSVREDGGFRNAVTKEFATLVTDGQLDIDFVSDSRFFGPSHLAIYRIDPRKVDDKADDGSDLLNFYLVDTETDEKLVQLFNGPSLDASRLDGKDLTIVAHLEGETPPVGSVVLQLNDGAKQIKNMAPYALFGDADGDYFGSAELDPGTHTLKFSVFEEAGSGGSRLEAEVLEFSII